MCPARQRQAIGTSEQVNTDKDTKFCNSYTAAQGHTAVRGGLKFHALEDFINIELNVYRVLA